MTSPRTYGGVEGAERQAERRQRLLDAGLSLLTAQPPTPVTVRGVCRQASVVARYFYENFTDIDEFVGAVFDSAIAHLAETTQHAVAAAPLENKTRAGIANLIRVIEQDPQVGQLLFSGMLVNAVVARRREQAWALFAGLSGQHLHTTYNLGEDDSVRIAAYFAVGGVGHTLAAWVTGQLELSTDTLIDALTRQLDGIRP